MTSSIREIPYDTHIPDDFVDHGYSDGNINVESAAASPTPYEENLYNGNGYTGYHGNGRASINGNESMVSGFNENGSTFSGFNGNGYNTNENGAAQFVRRRLLPSIPKGDEPTLLTFTFLCTALTFNNLLCF